MSSGNKPVSVSVLTEAIRHSLNQKFGRIFVEGEISGITRPQSGHIYLTLKDKHAQINAVIWRSAAERIPFQPEDGQKVICGGYIDIYPQRGTYQLIVQQLQPIGIGAIELAFRQLHAKLQTEGLFDPARKRSLPRLPKRIAVITSPTGAAIRDFMQVLVRRWPNVELLVLPVQVQGTTAADQIAGAFDQISKMESKPDLVVLTRGGGSKEDLWSFSQEQVCRAVYNCAVPVVSGVGHEIDVSLCDLVADVRALTPSEAAERIVPNQREVLQHLTAVASRLSNSIADKLLVAKSELDQIANRPVFARPFSMFEKCQADLESMEPRLRRAVTSKIQLTEKDIAAMAGKLEAINPLAVLSRGYSVTQKIDGDSTLLITSADQLNEGDTIETTLQRGKVTSSVVSIETD